MPSKIAPPLDSGTLIVRNLLAGRIVDSVNMGKRVEQKQHVV